MSGASCTRCGGAPASCSLLGSLTAARLSRPRGRSGYAQRGPAFTDLCSGCATDQLGQDAVDLASIRAWARSREGRRDVHRGYGRRTAAHVRRMAS